MVRHPKPRAPDLGPSYLQVLRQLSRGLPGITLISEAPEGVPLTSQHPISFGLSRHILTNHPDSPNLGHVSETIQKHLLETSTLLQIPTLPPTPRKISP